MGENVVSTLTEALRNAFGGFVQLGTPTGEKASVGEAARSRYIPAVPTPTSFVDVDQLYNSIRQSASVVDPTASTGGGLSPLTNTVLTQTANLGFTAGNWIADFQGASGQPAGISYEYNPKTKEFVVVDSRTKNQIVLIGDPSNPSQYQKLDYTTALNQILTPYRSQPGGIDALKQQLVNRGAWTVAQAKKSIGEDKALIGALVKVVDEMSRTNFFTGSQSAQFAPFKNFLTGQGGSKAGTTTNTGYYTTLTNEKAATDEIATFIKQYLNRGATAPEIEAYKKALNKFESEHPEKITSTVSTDATGAEKTRKQTRITGGATDTDKQAIMTGILFDSLKKTGYNVDNISQSGGLLARGMDAIKKQASDYGVQIDDTGALNSVLDAIKQGGSIDTEKEKIKQKAKLQYKNLSSAFDAGLTFRDVADQFNEYKKKYLETATPTDTTDPDIQMAINNRGKNQIMNLNDWVVYLKNKPEWRMTMNAREEAAGWIKAFGQEFGVLE